MVGAFDTCPFPISHIMFSSDDFIEEEQFDMIGKIGECFAETREIGVTIPVRSLLILSNMYTQLSSNF